MAAPGARHVSTLAPMSTPDGLHRRRAIALAAAIAAVIGCWILGNPRSSGPDEPSHMVASAGLVRGDFDGDPLAGNAAVRVFDVPGMVGAPDPGCWALDPLAPVGCAVVPGLDEQTAPRASTSSNYAPWAYVLPGSASFVPWGAGYAYLARAASAVVPAVLFAVAIARLRRRGRAPAVAALLGATPIVWFTFGTVNPSAMAIGGGLALTAGLLDDEEITDRWLAVAGWAAVLLARRDGPLWATAIVVTVCALRGARPAELFARLGRAQRIVALAVAPLPVLSVLERGDSGLNAALALAPAGLIAVEGVVRLWDRQPTGQHRAAVAIATGLLSAVGLTVLLSLRPGGLDTDVMQLVIGSTGEHLRQIVGVLGWLDAPVPTFATFLFWAAIGGLAAVAVLERPRSALVGVLAVIGIVVAAWVLELGQGADYGRYWQGRYSMPIAIGLPLLFAWRPAGRHLVDRLAVHVAVVAWVILNAGFIAAQRRWAVGIGGTWYPWRWDTWGSPIDPWLLVVAHLVATAWLTLTVLREPSQQAG